jgi:hypothetical protein
MPSNVDETPISSDLAALAAAIDRFSCRRRPNSPEEIGWEMIHLRHQCDRLELEFSIDAASFAATDEYDRQGSVSPIDWIRHQCQMGGGAAADRVAIGQLAPHLPESVEATSAGDIGFAHLALIARTAAATAAPNASTLAEAPLLEKAREFSVGRFRNFCDLARHAADADRYLQGEIDAMEARSLTIRQAQGGLVSLHGTLDPEGGAAVMTVLRPLARRNGKGDTRRKDRRLADALVEHALHSLDNSGRQSSSRPHLQVTTTFETLLSAAGAPAADLDLSIPISAKAVERIACDCNVTRILLGTDSAVIDVGRSRRVISPATRRALQARDKGCIWPGCDRPARWASGHHLVHWANGGATNLSNLVLLCARHHWMVHEGGWQIVLVDCKVRTVPPTLDYYLRFARPPSARAA